MNDAPSFTIIIMCLYFNTAGHLALSCDVSREQEVLNTFEEIQRNLGPINYLVNAAAINRLVISYKIICNSRPHCYLVRCQVRERAFAISLLLMRASEKQ